ncbi:hypothetical protein [Kitasatospora sp. HPMI-4]
MISSKIVGRDHAPDIEGARTVGPQAHPFTGDAEAIARIERHLAGC